MESAPINDSWLRRCTVLVLIGLLERFRPRQGVVLMLSDKVCVKHGPLVHLSEASTLRFIAQNTSIPVPKVYCAFERRGWTYIVMERIDGDKVGQGWVKRTEESKAKILSKLKPLIQQLRNVPAPGPRVSNVDGGSLYDPRLPGPLRFGPFDSVHDFHKHLHGGFGPDASFDPEVNELIRLHDQPWPPPVFTHGDLSSLNILARGDEIVGIIDWETAGWLPYYWEYTTACQVNPRNEFWRDEIDKFLDPMPTELAMEKIRQKYFGDF
ncbi:hypothetical protein BK809_0001302 [Diplodia seriata]|uniref:Aminoglycoside phosphotransferase domain-containing protein n=1 Tax=Diplodia seriata TaxID=420778 RepID=A0A1S8B8Q7_9PEZI|nr:hypothetical protein BK809_0001302 [Diplodia seriata]